MPIAYILEGFSSTDRDQQTKASEQLDELEEQGIDAPTGIALLQAAAEEYPPRHNTWLDSSAELVRAVAHQPQPDYLPEVIRLFAAYNPQARAEALGLLAGLSDRQAAQAFVQLLSQFGNEGSIARLITGPLEKEPHHPDIFFPALLEHVRQPSFEWPICSLCLRYFDAGLLEPGSLNSHLAHVLGSYQHHHRALAQAQQNEGVAWMWRPEYAAHRFPAGLLLDLLGYFPSTDTVAHLYSALALSDPRLKHFALISLLRLRQPVEPAAFVSVASSAEMRNWLYRKLSELDHLAFYPLEFRTQAAFAESDMVNWLAYPTELDRVPDEIELAQVMRVETGTEDGALLYYLFKFRTQPPDWAADKGWMAGVSGPFLEAHGPHPDPLGETFSALEAWDSRTPEQHIGDLQDIIARWREYRRDQAAQRGDETATN